MNKLLIVLLLFLTSMGSSNAQIQNDCNKSKTALIIIDIQNDYFNGGAMELVGAEEASEKAKLVLEKFRADKLPVIHIQHISNRAGSTFFLPNTFGVEIQENVKPLSNEKVIIKHYPNSFRETELLEYLKQEKITHLVIMGMMTHMCIDSTTRAAKDYGYDCTVIGDACATRDLLIHDQKVVAKDIQNSFLSGLSYYYAEITIAEDFISK